tara:strand:- start:38 stop:364 length:327 start_codon:yes stop_codon:yes gene_type:complete
MKTFQHQVSYKQEQDQSDIKEGLEFNEIPTHIEITTIFTKPESVTFIYSNDQFESWGWWLPSDNEQLIIDNYIKKFPATKDYKFNFISHQRFEFHNDNIHLTQNLYND